MLGGSLIFTMTSGYTTGPSAYPTSFTGIYKTGLSGTNYAGGAAWYLQPTAGAINPTWNFPGNDNLVAAMVSIK